MQKLIILSMLIAMVAFNSYSVNLNSLNISGAPVDSGNQITFSTSGTANLRVTLCSSDAARFWVAIDGIFTKEASYVVDTESWAAVSKTIVDKSAYYQILTSELSIRINKTPVLISIYKADDVTLITDEKASGGIAWDNSGVYSNWNMGANEHIFGLGEDNSEIGGALDRRGTSRNMRTGMDISNKNWTPSNYPVPFFMSTGSAGGGYGFYFDNTYLATFDMGKSSSQTFAWKAGGGAIVFYFMYGPSFKKILGKYTSLTGQAVLPPVWAFGYIQSKCQYNNWSEVDTRVSTMASNNLPLDMMVLDYNWPDCYGDFTWGSGSFTGGATKVGTYKSKCVRIMVSNSGPMLAATGVCASMHADAVSNGIFAKCGSGNCVAGYYNGDLFDVTAPKFQTWLWSQNQAKHLYQEGVAGWWLDLTEPENEPSTATYTAGPSAKIHNIFPNIYTKAYYQGQMQLDPNSRPYILTRCGFAGIQKYGATLWTGDIYSEYISLTPHLPESQSTSLSGIPYWTMDIGGFQNPSDGTQYYKNDKMGAHALLYQRWFEFGCFVPITRSHGVKDNEPYAFTTDVAASCKKYLSLRYRLVPYIYSYAWECYKTGLPIQRALVLEYQDDPSSYSAKFEYLFGKELLVAPVITEGATTKDVYFPDGTWYDIDDGTVYLGKTTKTVPAPQAKLPLFVKAGAILPMAPAQTHLTDETGAKRKWDPLTLEIYPSGTSTFSLYQDDGLSQAYRTNNQSTQTVITSAFTSAKQEIVSITESNKLFTPNKYECKIHLFGQSTVPGPITWNNQALSTVASQSAYTSAIAGFWWDATNKVLWAKAATTTATAYVLAVSLDGTPVSIKALKAAGALPKSFNMQATTAPQSGSLVGIKFSSIDATASIRIAFYDVLGRVAAVIAQGKFSEGYHTAALRKTNGASLLKNGLYFCRMEAPGFSKTLKVMVK